MYESSAELIQIRRSKVSKRLKENEFSTTTRNALNYYLKVKI